MLVETRNFFDDATKRDTDIWTITPALVVVVAHTNACVQVRACAVDNESVT